MTSSYLPAALCISLLHFLAGTAPGSQVWLYHCTGAANQQWKVVPLPDGTNQFVGEQSGLCLDGGTSVHPCNIPPYNAMPFCNTSLPVTERVANLVQSITADEQAGLFDTTSTGVPSLLISPYQWYTHTAAAAICMYML
jgi:hypothetical protein